VKHVFARRDLIHFNVQFVNAASVQKRGILQDAINATVSQIQQQLQAGIIQAQGVGSQIVNVIANVTAGLQTTATTILTQVSNFPLCATAQTTNVANIVSQAGMLLHQMYY
jgi:hypothetical protein